VLAGPADAAPGLGRAAGAYDQGAAGDPLQTVAQAYRTSYPDLAPEAAQAAAAAQASAGEALKAELVERWDTFGGGWFDAYTATYHLAVTRPAAGEALAAIGTARGVAVDTPVVDRSLDELNAQVEDLQTGDGALARAADGRVGIDVTTNQVVAAVPAGQVGSLTRQAPAGVTVIPAEQTAFEYDACTSRSNCDNFLAAGLVLRNGAGTPWCSLGFTARNAAGQRITLTAGHCSTGIGETWSNGTATIRTVGNVSGRIFSGNQDVSRIVSTNAFYGNVNSGRIYINTPPGWFPVTGESFLLVGDVACLSASFTNPARSGNPCGTVGSTSDPQRFNMVRIDGYDACGGDSGGGWYWLPGSGNRWAVALHSNSESGCNNPTAARSWASPLNAFYPDLVYETG
jgi:streptogrisin C